MAQPWEQVIEVLDHKHRAVAVLHIGGVDRRANHQAECIGDDVAFAAFDLLAGVVTARPAALVVLTDWLSMIPADGLGSRLAASRACTSNSKLIRCNVPSSPHA